MSFVYLINNNTDIQKLKESVLIEWGNPKLVVNNAERIQAKDGRSAVFLKKEGLTRLRGVRNDQIIDT